MNGTLNPEADRPNPESAALIEPDYVTTENFPHRPDKLFHLQIGVTYACQCKCRHCGVSHQRNRGKLLTAEEIVDLCRQAKEDLDAEVVELFGGEPLVHKQINTIVEGCSQHLDVWMSSNGINFTRQLAHDLKESGLKRCFFSLDSCDQHKHDANRNYPGCFESVLKAVGYCAELGIEANFSTCAMSELVISHELEELIEFTKKSSAHKLRLVLPKMSGRLKNNTSILLTKAQIERIRQQTAREEIAYVEAEGNYSNRIEKCFCLRGHVYVNPYGVVQPCVYTLLDFGNIRDYPLRYLYKRMFEHEIFKDKALLNLCLLQNTSFVGKYLSEISADNPIQKVAFGSENLLTLRKPEPKPIMNDKQQAKIYALSELKEPFLMFVDRFKETFNDTTVNGRVLDLGCGQGEVTFPFACAFPQCRIDAIDAAENMLYYTRKELERYQLAARVRVIRAHLPEDTLPAPKYDCIIANSFLHHLPTVQLLWDILELYAQPGSPIFIMDLIRPASGEMAKHLVKKYTQGLHKIIVRDFFYSLLAAFRVEEIEAQLKDSGLGHLHVKRINDVQLIIHGYAQ